MQVLVKAIEDDDIKALFSPFEKKVMFHDGSFEASVEYQWRTDLVLTHDAIIKFVVHVVSGSGRLGSAQEAILTIVATP